MVSLSEILALVLGLGWVLTMGTPGLNRSGAGASDGTRESGGDDDTSAVRWAGVTRVTPWRQAARFENRVIGG
jgi:hypothetical protein